MPKTVLPKTVPTSLQDGAGKTVPTSLEIGHRLVSKTVPTSLEIGHRGVRLSKGSSFAVSRLGETWMRYKPGDRLHVVWNRC